MNNPIRIRTVTLIARLLQPLAEEGVLTIPEKNEIVAQLKHLAEHGETMPAITPRLIDQTAAAEMLGISLANFKKLERESAFTFQRRMVGSAVRYRNTDIVKYITAED